jgi:hypothetical protein
MPRAPLSRISAKVIFLWAVGHRHSISEARLIAGLFGFLILIE